MNSPVSEQILIHGNPAMRPRLSRRFRIGDDYHESGLIFTVTSISNAGVKGILQGHEHTQEGFDNFSKIMGGEPWAPKQS